MPIDTGLLIYVDIDGRRKRHAPASHAVYKIYYAASRVNGGVKKELTAACRRRF